MDFRPIKEFMDRLTAWRIPGNSISICLNGREVFSYSSGFSNLKMKIPMQRTELLNIYSCSKVATVTAALQLYEKGYFLLDDPLYDYIPEFKEMYIKTGENSLEKAKTPITLRHLFTMTSGLTYNTDTDAFVKAREQTYGKMDTLSVIRCLAKAPLSFEPGECWQYSLSHDVLATVVELISGRRFQDYVKENIFEPLEMYDSYYHNENVQHLMAEQYRYESSDETDIVKLQSKTDEKNQGKLINVGKNVSLIFGPEYDSGGAGITTTVRDFSKLAAALSNSGKSVKGERILSKGTVELMRSNQLNNKQKETFTWEQLKGYGYGLGVRTLTDKALSGTTGNFQEFGWGGAAGATILVDVDRGISMFYAHHMLNPQEEFYQPRLRNILYACT